MRGLLTDRESAKILGIKINQLYDTVDFFDEYDGESLSELKEKAGDDFTWEELKLYRASLMTNTI